MRAPRSWRRGMAIAAVLALTATACGGDGEETADPGTEGTAEETTEATEGGGGETTEPSDGGSETGAAGEITTGTGVTEEPCPDAVNEDNGCIYLGILSDLTDGPFAGLAVPIVAGQQAFWTRVNENGGIGGAYDVNISEFTRDTHYNPQQHVAAYNEIEPEVLALAQTLGTPPTLAIKDLMIQDKVVGVPASWWSGWSVPDADGGVILESGQPYCIESMNSLDWYAQDNEVASVMSVGYPGDYGGDGAAGASLWAEMNGAEYLGFTQTAPNAAAGNQDAAVSAILSASPDVVQLSTGPAETAEIVGKAVAQGFEGQFLGSVPTYNPALLESPAAPALQQSYVFGSPWGPFGADTAAHDAMAEAVGEDLPANDGFTFGWIWSYPLEAVLQAAAEAGDLTRDGLLAAVETVEVDYEGALPTRTYGEPNETVVRSAVMVAPDPEAPLGASVIAETFTGPTAESFEFTEPCFLVE